MARQMSGMKKQKTFRQKFIPMRYYLAGYILLLIIPILVAVSIIDYFDTRWNLMENYRLLREQTENEIVNAIDLIDSGYKMFEKTLERKMREGFKPFLDAYERAGRDPSTIDLSALKEQLGGTMDLYIINKDYKVVYSTYATDIGEFLKKRQPYLLYQ